MKARDSTARPISPELRRAIRDSRGSVRAVAARYGVNPKTVVRWRAERPAADRRPAARGLSPGEEALALVFRQHSRLPLDDCLAALVRLLPRLSRSALHRCYQRHGLSRVPARDAADAIGHVAIDRTTGDGRFLFVAVDRASCMAFAEVQADGRASSFVDALVASLSNPVQSITVPAALAKERGLAATCAGHGIVLRIAGQGWSAAQRAAVEAAVARADTAEVEAGLLPFVTGFNLSCELRALGGRTPYAAMRELRPEPARFEAAHDSVQLPRPRPHRRAQSTQKTRAAILEAARTRLAQDGPEGLSVAEVARVAGVNRGTAYQHFETREKLVRATTDWVSEQLHAAIFGAIDGVPVEAIDVAQVSDRLAWFAMDNPELCRGWLLHLLSSEDPGEDRFWRAYQGAAERFARSPNAQPGIDPEVLSVIMLAGAFLWPVWAEAKGKGQDKEPFAERYAQESLRLSLYGTLRREAYPAIAARVERGRRR